MVVGFLLLNIKLYIGITEAITKLATAATALIGETAAAATVQNVAQVLVREGVTLTSPCGAGRRLLGGRVQPLVDIVPRWRRVAQR